MVVNWIFVFISAACTLCLTEISFGEIGAITESVGDRIAKRIETKGIKSAIMGGLIYLDDTQIRQRWGLSDPRYDSCSGDGCAPLVPGMGQGLPLPLPFTRNFNGEWSNFINIYPDFFVLPNGKHESSIQIQDSNMFVTAGIIYPLYIFDESGLPYKQRIISEMRREGLNSVRRYKRGNGFSFWPLLPGSTSAKGRVGPLNIPMVAGNGMQLMKLFPMRKPVGNPLHIEWNQDVLDPSMNPYGLDALANIPNDIDDTSVAFASFLTASKVDNEDFPQDDFLDMIRPWRDLDRKYEDGRDGWKGKNSGAFLTWMKDEDLPRFERFLTPESGVIPLAVNNVDCVVNANAVFALGLSGKADSPEAEEVSKVLEKAVGEKAWPECGLYYPQKMIFPYALSRAFREGNIRNDSMYRAVRRLLIQLVEDQTKTSKLFPRHDGAFSGGVDRTFDLSTALALATLLNIGRDIAESENLGDAYDETLRKAVSYLISKQKKIHIKFVSTFNRDNQNAFYPNPFDFARAWDSGLFFSASKWNLAQWRSSAYTTSIVLEALGKYLLGYDLREGSFQDGLRLKVLSYGRSAEHAEQHFKVKIDD